MAATDKARDFLARFVSDFSRFRTEPAADQLEALGDDADASGRKLRDLADDADASGRQLRDAGSEAGRASADLRDLGSDADRARRDMRDLADDAGKAGRELRELGDDADRSGADVKGLGDDADATARQVDDALDRIAASSRANLRRKLGDDADEGGDKLREVGDEGRQVSLELASSFDGSAESVADSFQDMAANGLQAFGPIGVAAGTAAGLVVGYWRGARERVREAVQGLTGDLIDAGGQLEREGVLGQLRTFADDGTLTELADQARAARIPVSDFLLAAAGDPAAMERTAQAVERNRAGLAELATATGVYDQSAQDVAKGLNDVQSKLDETATTYGLAQEAVSAYDAAARKLDETTNLQAANLEAYGSSLAAFVDPLGAYTDKLAEKDAAEQAAAQATADATEDSADSWEDYAKAQSVSVGEYLDELRKMVTAQESWHANMVTLAGKVSEDTLAELERLGPEGAPLVAQLVTASDAELGELDDLYARRASSAVSALTAELDAGAVPAGQAGASVGQAFVAGLARQEANARAAAARVRDASQRYLDGSPLVIRTELDPSGYNAGLQSLVGRGPRVRI